MSSNVEIVEVYVVRKTDRDGDRLYLCDRNGVESGIPLALTEIVKHEDPLPSRDGLHVGVIILDACGRGWVVDEEPDLLNHERKYRITFPVGSAAAVYTLHSTLPEGPLTLLAREGQPVDDVVMFA